MPSNIKAEQIALSFASGVTVGGMSLDDDDLCPARTSRSSSVVVIVNGACDVSSPLPLDFMTYLQLLI